jgi:hypothetical protein
VVEIVWSCLCGTRTRTPTADDVARALLDVDWTPPDVTADCLWCGPASLAVAAHTPIGSPAHD